MSSRKRHLLLVEDSQDLQYVFANKYGQNPSYLMHFASNTKEALGLVQRESINVAVVSLSLEGKSLAGLDVIHFWREKGYSFPIIVLSNHDFHDVGVRCLNLGADDYIRKPASFEEIAARINRHLHRTYQSIPSKQVDGIALPDTPFYFCQALISPDLTAQFPGGQTIRLMAKQFGLMHFMSQHPGQLILRENLLVATWGADANLNSNSLNQYLSVLRGLFKKNGMDLNQWIKSESKVGWRLHKDLASPPVPHVVAIQQSW
ncbi:MAG TPA: response regulator transcription factor [Opitutaceae bacterium]|nr:response regulator transcription factor [Opitutaceae bacterium]